MSVTKVATRILLMQFSFTNKSAVPKCIPMMDDELLRESHERKQVISGVQIIPPILNVDVKPFLTPLVSSGYELVDARYQPRVDRRNARKTYHMIRFVFCRHEYAKVTDQFAVRRDACWAALSEMCTVAMWRVRGYRNPLIVDGEQVDGECAISLNFEKREPFYDKDDNPVCRWRKDKNNRRIGDAPVPLSPEHYVDFSDGEVRVLPSS